MKSTIELNGNQYDLKRIALIHAEGNKTKVQTSDLVGLEEAETSQDITSPVVVSTGSQLLVLLKPAAEIKGTTVVYLLSKFILKKALSTNVYEAQEAERPYRPSPYSRDSGRGGRYDNDRSQGRPPRYGSYDRAEQGTSDGGKEGRRLF